MSDKMLPEFDSWLKSINKQMDAHEKLQFIANIFMDLQDRGVVLPFADYDIIDRYIQEISNYMEEK